MCQCVTVCDGESHRHAVLQSYHQQTMEELHNLEEDIKATQQAEEQAMVTH